MEIEIFASGSGGNCSLVSSGGSYILIDCGISARRINNFLAHRGLSSDDLAAILITHEHSDHVAGLAQLTKRCPITIYASRGTADFICDTLPQTSGMLRSFDAGDEFDLAGLRVRSFATPHDALDSVGYRLEDESGALGYATDLGHVPDGILEVLRGVDKLVLESNHDIDLLRFGPYPEHLKARILGPRGHLSNDLSADTLGRLIEYGVREVWLAHLSQQNNRPKLARSAAEAVISRLGAENEVSLNIAPVLAAE